MKHNQGEGGNKEEPESSQPKAENITPGKAKEESETNDLLRRTTNKNIERLTGAKKEGKEDEANRDASINQGLEGLKFCRGTPSEEDRVRKGHLRHSKTPSNTEKGRWPQKREGKKGTKGEQLLDEGHVPRPKNSKREDGKSDAISHAKRGGPKNIRS